MKNEKKAQKKSKTTTTKTTLSEADEKKFIHLAISITDTVP